MVTALQLGLNRYFYWGMSLLICLVVAIGFGPHLDRRLLHPATPVPHILYWHAMVFTAWVLLFATQTSLARFANVRLHRRLGTLGAGLGVVLPLLGLATAFAMQKWHGTQDEADLASLSIPINDMLAFSACFWLAIVRRRQVEWHRRLMLIASCCLTVAAFARFPGDIAPFPWMYAYVDGLIALGALRDAMVNRRIHAAYCYGLPAVMLGQWVAVYLATTAPPVWMRTMRFFLE